MPKSVSLRILICDPEKGSREQLCASLAGNPLVEESTPTDSTTELLELLAAKHINLLFIDPVVQEMEATSRLIFQVREKFPEVIICLFFRFSAVSDHADDFYDGERERFSHYFKLNKELSGRSFDEETSLRVAHFHDAARRWKRYPGRIQLTNPPKFMTLESPPIEEAKPAPRRSKKAFRPAPVEGTLPANGFMSSVPGLKHLARRFSQS